MNIFQRWIRQSWAVTAASVAMINAGAVDHLNAQDGPVITGLERQPFVAAARRLTEAMDFAGAPFSEEVQQEDIALCEAVQRNLHSRFYSAGRYCPRRENGVHHFHSLLREALA